MHSHGPHVHGIAKLTLALETPQSGAIEFESPADSVMGFEYEAKSPADQKIQKEALLNLRVNMAGFLGLPAAWHCSLLVKKVELKAEDHDEDEHEAGAAHAEHREVEAEYAFKCETKLAGKTLEVNFAQAFPRIQQLDVQVLQSDKQNLFKLKSGKGSVNF